MIRKSDVNLINGLGVNVYASRAMIYGRANKGKTKETRSLANLLVLLYHQAKCDLDLPAIDIKLARLERLVDGTYQHKNILIGCEWGYVSLRWPADDIGATIVAFAHELVHANQYKRGDLIGISKQTTEPKSNVRVWQDQEIEIPKNPSHIEYMNFPWEIEAFSRQFDLVQSWVQRAAEKRIITDVKGSYLNERIICARNQWNSEYCTTMGKIFEIDR